MKFLRVGKKEIRAHAPFSTPPTNKNLEKPLDKQLNRCYNDNVKGRWLGHPQRARLLDKLQ